MIRFYSGSHSRKSFRSPQKKESHVDDSPSQTSLRPKEMVNFGKVLLTEAVPHYVDYEALKAQIEAAQATGVAPLLQNELTKGPALSSID